MAMEGATAEIGCKGDMPWGMDFCHFFETKQDLLDASVPFFQAGLKQHEFCIWNVYDPITEDDALAVLHRCIPGVDRLIAEGGIEIRAHTGPPPECGFDTHRGVPDLRERLDDALARGYAGMRVAGTRPLVAATRRQGNWERVETEELRRQKEILQTIFDHIPVMVSFVDRNNRVKLVNREWERVLGWSFEEMQGQDPHIVVDKNYPDPEARRQARDFIRKSDGAWADFKTTVRDGRVIDTSWAILKLSDGAAIAIGQDISARKQAEQELRKQKEVLQTIFDHIPVMVGFVDRNGQAQLVNREWERTLGWSLEEIRGQNIDLIAENYPDPEYRKHVRDFLRNCSAEWADFKTRVRDGRVIDTCWAMLQLSDGTGIGIGQDITERKRVEEALRDSEERLRQITENIREVFWLRSHDLQQLLYVSPMYEQVCGSSWEAAHAAAPETVVHPEDHPWVMETLKELAGREFEIEYRIITKEGDVRWIRDRGFPIHDKTGALYRIGGVAEDITDRKEAEDRLKASSEQLRALSASLQSARESEAKRIAHQIHDELGGHLTGLRWELEALEKMLQQPASAEQVSAMRDQLATMLGLTDTTINAVRQIASELRPSILDDLGLPEAVEWQTQQFQMRTGIECRCDCALQSSQLGNQESTAVFRIVQEALTNILRHAQATRVSIATKEEDGMFILTVTDNGRGITPAEKLSRNALGLLGMQERAHLIGGCVDIVGRTGIGTTLSVRVPLGRPAPQGAP